MEAWRSRYLTTSQHLFSEPVVTCVNFLASFMDECKQECLVFQTHHWSEMRREDQSGELVVQLMTFQSLLTAIHSRIETSSVQILFLELTFVNPATATQSFLSGYSKSIFLPFTSSFSSKRTPRVSGSILGEHFNLPVDTGSTGIIIGAPLLPQIGEDEGSPGWEFLSSSRLLYIGRHVKLTVKFHGAKDSEATSVVPVLIVDESLHCPWYNPGADQGACPENEKEPTPNDINKITYMGVGFGRNTPDSGIPFGTPEYNPFLNIKRINGKKVNEEEFRIGYTVSTKGVRLGLTEKKTRGYAWVPLNKGATEDPRDWAPLTMSFKVNNKERFDGNALIDTGIPQMFIQAQPYGFSPNVTIKNDDPPPKFSKRVKPGTKLSFAFPSFDDGGIAGYYFKVGDKRFPSQPLYVAPDAVATGPFVNTGRNFLYGFSIAFDAIGGQFGFLCKLCE
ncbi:hypothetical protein BS50DRAFT_642118 [Corynespora cassiicola Philippines]|uniref:Acid protease n=1 Tax=Corynespora cassiicola Philippines TaxID=1448308 RepID=A0A2T2P8Q1_CORCC|nr:hypothetical protein BS50DRAFT_642118 [Corynespora cassiicola Philippines]